MLVYQKKALLKQKITGINFLFLKSLIKILSLFVVLFFLGCDFRIPQDWETPEWEFDLSIPLINEEYLMASIASSSNDIEITPPDSSDFIISINEPIIEIVLSKDLSSIIKIRSSFLDSDNIISLAWLKFLKSK